ncbi:hypothetical protein [Ligilactobacillus agilis]|uniref:hypothetical protein n=1 Tax=Ligilactobacillus agilis TaxID=1601 RepID=UPI0014375908|nr:hypothetical protein [Ligilactobacillus agilis]GET19708.1 hypothetical protein PTL465_20260 [Ligilactobacillus agilis]
MVVRLNCADEHAYRTDKFLSESVPTTSTIATQQQDLSKHFTALRLPADLLINSATKQRLIFSALNKSASKYHLNYLEKCADVGYSYDWLGLKPTSNYHNHYTFYVHHLATSMIR